ncbi:MAG: SurA N-terminal domain-containing protein [Alphaproteobacteria bacterium]|nr:SurA N-terminal domain-containing protein [Alphaproteobacteria bacterium]
MLQEMRKYSKSWAANILLGVLALAFVSWGIGDIFQGGVSTSVADVGGAKIDQSEFQRDYTNYVRSAGEQRGKVVSADEARRGHMSDIVLQQEISRAAIDNLVHQLGLTASDTMVAEEIKSVPAFAGITGTFDQQTFQQRIQRYGYTEQGFEQLVRQDIARSQLVHAAEGGFVIPFGYARALFAYSTEERAVDYITVDPKILPPIAPPSDSALQAYIKAHPERYSTPEYRDVTFAWISPDDVAASVNIPDSQVKAAYDNNQDRYVTPEKREIERLDFASESDAQAARAKLGKSMTFEQLAESVGQKDSANLGELVAADLDPSLSGPVFSLAAGGVSQPLKSGDKWALFHVVKVTPGKTTTFDQAKDAIRKDLVQQVAQSKIVDIANAYTDASSGGMSLTDAAKKAGMHSGHTVMDRNGLAPDGTKANAPDDADFRAQIFRAEAGEEGDPQPSKSGSYYVVSVNGITPPKLKPLDAVRAQALADWTNDQRKILLRQKAESVAAQANSSHSLADAAKSLGATVQSSPALTHATKDVTFSQDLVAQIFDAMPGQTVFGPSGANGNYIVAQVTGIAHPVPPVNDPNFIQGVRLISSGVASGITESFSDALKAKQGVKINSKLVNTVAGSEGS